MGREGGRGGYESVCKQKFMALVPMQEPSHYQDREQQRLNRFGGGGVEWEVQPRPFVY